MRRWLVVWLWLLPVAGMGQEALPTVWRHYVEQLAEEDEEGALEDLLALYEECRDNPVNINDTNDGLARLVFVDHFQRESLRAYQALYGPLLSVEELYGVAGFDSTTVELLRPLVVAGPLAATQRQTLKELLRSGRSNLVVGTSGTVELARGYAEEIYEGDNRRLLWRYYYKCGDRVQFQVSGDKDPGEALFAGSQRQGFDFYGFGLLLNDVGRYATGGLIGQSGIYVKRLAVGQYHLQFGQGLALWSGYGSRTAYEGRLCRYGQGIRPSGAFSEYGYLQGGAATLALRRRWNMTLFYSSVDRSATRSRATDSSGTAEWVQSIYNSGYHRTPTEIAKKHQLGERLWGGNLTYQGSRLRVGVSCVGTLFSKRIVPARYYYNDNAFSGDGLFNAGVDFVYRRRRLFVFGEAAICRDSLWDTAAANLSPAALVGAEWTVGANHRLSAQARHYSPFYHHFHASAIGQGSAPQNETGAAVYYHGRLPWGMTADVSVDFFWFPHIKYQVYAPSSGTEWRVDFGRESDCVKGLRLRLRYRHKVRQKNVMPTQVVDGEYAMEQTYRNQIQGEVEYGNGPWRLVTRGAYASYVGDVTEASGGLLFYQDVQYRHGRMPLTVAARVALFDVDDYEARLYTVESDFVYQYGGAVYQNEGFRLYLLLKYDFSDHWNVGVKYALTTYRDKDTFGTGYEQIDGNHRQQWRIQIRWKW